MTLPLPSSPHWPPTRMMTMFLRGLSWRLFGSRLGTPCLEVVEASVTAPELELDGAGWSVSVLRHMDLGDARLFIALVVLGPIEKHDNVGVLLDRVVGDDVSCDEVMKAGYGQIEYLIDPVRSDRCNLVPVNLIDRCALRRGCVSSPGETCVLRKRCVWVRPRGGYLDPWLQFVKPPPALHR